MAEPDTRDGQRDRVFRAAIAPLIDVAYRVLRRLGVHDREVDDALQTVLVAADRKFEELDGPTVLKAFVCASCVNVARDLGRRRAKATARTKDVENLDQAPTSEPGPEDVLGRKEGLAMVQRILTSMDEEKRVVFVLYELEELTGQEIADHLGLPVGTVSSRLRKAREEFRAAIARAHASERNLERSGR